MRILLLLSVFLSCESAHGDSGGPYDFVPVKNETDAITVSQIPDYAFPLAYYGGNIPKLVFSEATAEPNHFRWMKCRPGIARLSRMEPPFQDFRAVEYLDAESLDKGQIKVDSILILQLLKDTNNYKPVFYSHPGVMGIEYSYTQPSKLGEKWFITVTKHIPGSGQIREHIYLGLSMKGQSVSRMKIWADNQGFWKELNREGWEPWTRGHAVDPVKQKSFHHIFKKHPVDGEYPHRWIEVDYVIKDGLLHARDWKFVPGLEPQ